MDDSWGRQKMKQTILKYIRLGILGLTLAFWGCSHFTLQSQKSQKLEFAQKPDFYLTGKASWYGGYFHGRKTANGEIYNMYSLTAAHKSLPFGSVVKVTNLQNQKTVFVRINDRGPYIQGRHIDLSLAAAQKLGMVGSGVVPVKLEVFKPFSG